MPFGLEDKDRVRSTMPNTNLISAVSATSSLADC